MKELLAHAARLGVAVHAAHLPAPWRGFYDADGGRVVYDIRLTPVARACVLAHELGHVFYGHTSAQDEAGEALADYYAACLLIDPAEYARAVRVSGSVEAVADELGVEARLLRVWVRRALTRVGGATYVRSRMGAGQHSGAWVHGSDDWLHSRLHPANRVGE